MLKIASYSLQGQTVRVKLKCSCGAAKVIGVSEENKTIYYCVRCRSRKTLDQLKREASSYWRKRNWVIACEPDQRANSRIHVQFPARLTVRASPSDSPRFVFHGQCRVISASGALIVVDDFQESCFQEITTTHRHAEILMEHRLEFLPPTLVARIVAVRYRPETLPKCDIAVAFVGLSSDLQNRLREYIEKQLHRADSA
ncbi:MAG: PilZ domain-containing protein [Candidatus Sumerlaeia bacterium]|nr:PilZ domain-containing protein [Candidatus Sumerlaeia bacterium]